MRLARSLGIAVLAVWLIVFGLSKYINLGDLHHIVYLLAIVAGVLLLINR